MMNNPKLSLIVDDSRWEQQLPAADELCQHVFAAVLEYISQTEPSELTASNLPPAVNLSLSNDAEVQRLNKEFRGLDKPTNVLSFANIDDPDFALEPAGADSLELGDIIIALETLEAEAAQKGISLRDHFCHLFAHGLLHLLGYDHQEDAEAEHMEGLEVQILQQLNIRNPYEE